MVLEDNLSSEGAEVTLVGNGREAVECGAAAGADAFDLVLMDVQMPVMDGHEGDSPVAHAGAWAAGHRADRPCPRRGTCRVSASGMVDRPCQAHRSGTAGQTVLRYRRGGGGRGRLTPRPGRGTTPFTRRRRIHLIPMRAFLNRSGEPPRLAAPVLARGCHLGAQFGGGVPRPAWVVEHRTGDADEVGLSFGDDLLRVFGFGDEAYGHGRQAAGTMRAARGTW